MSKDNKTRLQFTLKFLAPRYWGIWIMFGFVRLLALLPYPIMMATGRGLGNALYAISKAFKLKHYFYCKKKSLALLSRAAFAKTGRSFKAHLSITWLCTI